MRVTIKAPGGYTDRYGVFHERGTVADLSESIAQKIIAHGIAVPAPTLVETAEAAPRETAARTRKPATRK